MQRIALRHRAFSSALPAAAAAAPLLSAAALSRMTAAQVAAYAGSALALSARSQALLQSRGVTGAALLCMDLARLEALGVLLPEAAALLRAAERARHGAPVTVQLLLGPDRQPGALTLETPRELEALLARLGAAGLRSSSQVLVTRLSDLREGEAYTVGSGERGSLAEGVAWVKDSSATDAKVVIDNVKRAVVAASAKVFGEALAAEPRNDIALKCEGELLGDVGCLFKGPTLHLLLERKRRLSSAHGAASLAIAQMTVTRRAYVRLGLHLVGGRACRVESMLCADALDAAAQEELLQAGVYVLSQADMRIHAPGGLA